MRPSWGVVSYIYNAKNTMYDGYLLAYLCQHYVPDVDRVTGKQSSVIKPPASENAHTPGQPGMTLSTKE